MILTRRFPEVTTVLPDLTCETTFFDHDTNLELHSYRNVIIDNRDGLMLSRFRIVDQTQILSDRIKQRLPSISSLLKSGRFEGRVCIHLLGKNAGSYGHFIFEQFPRLLRYREKLGGRLDDVVILVKPESANWLSQILANFDFGSPEIYTVSKSVKVERLYYLPPPRNKAGIFDEIDGVRCRKILKCDGLNFDDKPKKIFLSRSRARKRVLLNESELLQSLLETYPDIIRVDPADLSFEDEIAMALNCQFVVGAAGQNFALGPFLGDGVNVWILAKRDTRPFNWASRFALMGSIYGGSGYVSFPTFDWPDFHDDWVYDPDVFSGQARLIGWRLSQD